MKNATHIGIVQRNGFPSTEPRETRLRETPKMWTDGKMRWPKFDRRGNPTENPSARTPHSYNRSTLLTSTIRPITTAELRQPLEAQVALAKRSLAWFIEEETEARKRVEGARENHAKMVAELAAFDRKHKVKSDE